MVRRALVSLVVLLILIYAGDAASVRYRIPRGRNPYGTVTIERYDAIPQKNNKTEYVFEEPLVETCVHSLFPHTGYLPCWYLNRRKEQRINY